METSSTSHPPTTDGGGQFNVDYMESGTYSYGSYKLGDFLILGIAILICMLGCLGNGHMIWLLCFHIKRNPFTTYILNMAVADIGTLVFLFVFLILFITDFLHEFSYLSFTFKLRYLCHFTYTASLCFLTVISMERCLSALFPRWYQCHRPTWLSSGLSFLIWTLSAMFYGMQISFFLTFFKELYAVTRTMFIVNFWVLPALLCVSTSVLLTKVCCNSQRWPARNLNTVILLLLLFVLIFRVPSIIAYYLYSSEYSQLVTVLSCLLYSINNSIKPILYYLVGKRWRYSSTEPMKVVLQRIFQDEAYFMEVNEQSSANTAGEVTC
ncbi:proto-oncogene Mas-like [Elgaria multicarinata webbii]|uniref:proto-oncogene Mas-like n=1 Tax=Elgaria multicarinata webbii TaxID=159646 RepID=UPI002FCCF128